MGPLQRPTRAQRRPGKAMKSGAVEEALDRYIREFPG
jgi:hypothetical protein